MHTSPSTPSYSQSSKLFHLSFSYSLLSLSLKSRRRDATAGEQLHTWQPLQAYIRCQWSKTEGRCEIRDPGLVETVRRSWADNLAGLRYRVHIRWSETAYIRLLHILLLLIIVFVIIVIAIGIVIFVIAIGIAIVILPSPSPSPSS